MEPQPKSKKALFVAIEKLIIKYIWKIKIVKIILGKKNKFRGLIPPDFKTYYINLQ